MGFGHREQPKIGEEGSRPLCVIKAASSLTWPVFLAAQNRPQTAADKAVERREYQPMGMLEVAKPAAQGRVERRNHALNGVTHGTLGLGADFVPQDHQTFAAHPSLPC